MFVKRIIVKVDFEPEEINTFNSEEGIIHLEFTNIKIANECKKLLIKNHITYDAINSLTININKEDNHLIFRYYIDDRGKYEFSFNRDFYKNY